MEHANEFPVELMCRLLSVSRSGYYAWLKQRERLPRRVEAGLDEAIKQAFEDSEQTYGSPRIGIELRRKGHRISDATVARRMRAMKLKVLNKRSFTITTNSKHDQPIADNLLQRNFQAEQANQKWVSDLTYFRVAQKWYYLTTIIDLFDRAVVGWAISDNMTARDTTIAAFRMAQQRYRPTRGLILHSDRGIQYACRAFRAELKAAGARPSMSRKADCYDNAVAESFFRTIKRECIDRRTFDDEPQAYTTIFRYIEGWYNTRRIHTSANNMAPLQLRRQKTNPKRAA